MGILSTKLSFISNKKLNLSYFRRKIWEKYTTLWQTCFFFRFIKDKLKNELLSTNPDINIEFFCRNTLIKYQSIALSSSMTVLSFNRLPKSGNCGHWLYPDLFIKNIYMEYIVLYVLKLNSNVLILYIKKCFPTTRHNRAFV